MKNKKFLTISVVLMLIACLTMVAACGNSSSDDNEDTPPEPPSGGFVNPGDNLGGGGTGTRPTEADVPTADGITVSDLSELSSLTDSGDATVIEGSDETLTITKAGSYVLKGEFKGGVVVSVSNGETTHLYLAGATVTSDSGIALSNTNKKSDLVLTAVGGTRNVISNSGDGNAVHVKGNLSVNGNGSIEVKSESKNAIKVSKSFVAVDVNLTLSAQNHALSARSVEIQNATVTVTAAGKDGINAECDDDTTEFSEDYSEGYVILKDVALTATVSGDGVQADTLVYVSGGEINVKTNGEFVKYSEENKTAYDLADDDFRYVKNGSSYQKVASDYRGNVSSRYALAQSCKGIKVGEIKYEDESGNEITVTEGDYLIVITDGAVVNVDSTDDAVHANSGSVLVDDASLTLNTYDDGITSDVMTYIKSGTIDVQSSYEGIEGAYVRIDGGKINIVSSDDGINAASDDESVKEYIIINGGEITVNASGDGIDSNGSVLMTGGTIIVYGPTSGGDGALDAETGIIVDGGTLVAASTLGMVETPSSNSSQYVVSYATNGSIAAGSVLSVKNASGEEILSFTAEKDCQSIIFSHFALENGEMYTISLDGETAVTFTVEGIITTVGSAGGAGGPGGQGGNPPQKPGGRR